MFSAFPPALRATGSRRQDAEGFCTACRGSSVPCAFHRLLPGRPEARDGRRAARLSGLRGFGFPRRQSRSLPTRPSRSPHGRSNCGFPLDRAPPHAMALAPDALPRDGTVRSIGAEETRAGSRRWRRKGGEGFQRLGGVGIAGDPPMAGGRASFSLPAPGRGVAQRPGGGGSTSRPAAPARLRLTAQPPSPEGEGEGGRGSASLQAAQQPAQQFAGQGGAGRVRDSFALARAAGARGRSAPPG